MLSENHIEKIAKLTNTLIDLPLAPEWLEYHAFEKAIRLIDEQIDAILPPEMKQLLNKIKDSDRLNRDHSGDFTERLVQALNKKLDLPFLGEQQEEKLIRTVAELIAKAMASTLSLDEILDGKNGSKSGSKRNK